MRSLSIAALACLACLVSGTSAGASGSAWQAVDAFKTPSNAIYCQLEQDVVHGGNRIFCAVGAVRDSKGQSPTVRLTEGNHRPRIKWLAGNGGDVQQHVAYNRWYAMYGGTVKIGPAHGVINCIVRRSSGMLCRNAHGHGFQISTRRRRTF